MDFLIILTCLSRREHNPSRSVNCKWLRIFVITYSKGFLFSSWILSIFVVVQENSFWWILPIENFLWYYPTTTYMIFNLLKNRLNCDLATVLQFLTFSLTLKSPSSCIINQFFFETPYTTTSVWIISEQVRWGTVPFSSFWRWLLFS